MKKILTLIVTAAVGCSVLMANSNKNAIAVNSVKATSTVAMITGSVVDRVTGEPLTGVCIFLPEIAKTVYTDFEGNFKINNLQPGKYTIKPRFISYDQNQDLTIEIKGNEVHALKVILNPITN